MRSAVQVPRAVGSVGSWLHDMSSPRTQTSSVSQQTSPELVESLSHPTFARADREKILNAVLLRIGATKIMQNFTLLLLDHNRVSIVPDISRELDAMIDEKVKRVRAVVTSATMLSPIQLRQLKTALETMSGKSVEMEHKEDPELLGGVIAQVGDVVYDGSLRSQLVRLREGLA